MVETQYYTISDSESEDETNPGGTLLFHDNLEQSETEYESDEEPDELEEKDLDFKTFEYEGFNEQKYKCCLRCNKIKKVKYYIITKKPTINIITKYSGKCRQCLNTISRMKTKCGCGSIISFSSQTRHNKSKKHQDYLSYIKK